MKTQILTQTCIKIKGVFTKRLMKTLSVPITSVALLIGFVGSSSANEFTASMTSGDETYYSDSGYITHTAEVETSHVFAEVDWYVNDVWQTTSKGDGAKKTASFTKGFSGNGYGRNYEIEAVAYSEDGRNASDSHRIRVKKNVVRYDGGSVNDLGYAEITTCGWSGLTSSASMHAEVNNISGAPVSAFYEFSYWVIRVDADHNAIVNGGLYNANLPVADPVLVANGSSYSTFFSDSHTITEGDVRAGEKGELEAKVTVDVWQDGKSIGSWTASKKEYYTPPRNK